MNVLLTGGTGFLGGNHVLEFLEQGHQVTCLVRSQDKFSARERLAQAIGHEACSRVRVVSGDITLSLGGLSLELCRSMRGQFDCLVHHAGSVKFEEEARAYTFLTNVDGTANMLALAENLEIGLFCYDSSIYAVGKVRNPYEESKEEAEKLVRNRQRDSYLILRPSIVVGHSETGDTTSYTGFYGWFTGFSYLKHNLRKLWNGDKSSCHGFKFDGDNLIFIDPFWLDYSLTSTLNLIPFNWLVREMTEIVVRGERNREYNLVDPNPQRVAWVIETSLKILGIQGVRRRDGETQLSSDPILAKAQCHMAKRLGIYEPYTNFELGFDCDALGGPPPLVDLAFLETMLRYAVETRFGHPKREAVAV